MPFIDFNTDIFENTEAGDFDCIIIGAGIAGIMISIKLAEKNKKVLLIESGHFTEDAAQQRLNRVVQTGKHMAAAVEGRKRAIGGTSIAWGGQSLPFSPIDFEKRNWIENSGWPIKYEALVPYYPLANRFLGIDEWNYESDIFKKLKYDPLHLNSKLIYQHFSKWAPQPNMKTLHGKTLERDVTVLYNCILKKINIEQNSGNVKTIELVNSKHKSQTIDVTKLILTTGGIETNRILLGNTHQIPGGIGNSCGLLGKGFMEHPSIVVGHLDSNGKSNYSLQRMFNTHIYKKRKYSLRLSLTADAQINQKLANGSAAIMFSYAEGQKTVYDIFAEKKIFSVKNLVLILKNIKSISLSVYAYLIHKFIYKHKAKSLVGLIMEQEPCLESSISLSNETDIFGLQLAKINWVITEKTWNSVLKMCTYLKEEFIRLNIGRLQLKDCINSQNTDWQLLFTDANHHMGGTRIGLSAQEGVVDQNLKVWGHNNLFICSSSVFPTSSHSNPTLTIMALGLRLVDYLTDDAQP